MLVIEDLHVHLGRSHVLQGVSLEARANEITALIGRNGVGKTTTLRAIMGLLRLSKGRVGWNGVDLASLSTDRIVRRGLGWVPDRRGNFHTMSVLENLRVAYFGPAREWKSRLAYIYKMFPILDERRHQMAGLLSGGQQQMLAIGKALITPRQFLLLDEPTQGLSPQVAHQLLRTLMQLRKDGVGLILVEQSLEAALSVSDHVLVMEKGTIKFAERRSETKLDTLVNLMGISRHSATQ